MHKTRQGARSKLYSSSWGSIFLWLVERKKLHKFRDVLLSNCLLSGKKISHPQSLKLSTKGLRKWVALYKVTCSYGFLAGFHGFPGNRELSRFFFFMYVFIYFFIWILSSLRPPFLQRPPLRHTLFNNFQLHALHLSRRFLSSLFFKEREKRRCACLLIFPYFPPIFTEFVYFFSSSLA